MIIFLFGEMGCGKNFVGNFLAKKLGYVFHDGDDDLPLLNKMFGFFSKDDVGKFVKNNLIKKIVELTAHGEHVLVAQALYFDEHRKLLQERFGKDNIKFIHVTSSLENQEQRLRTRRCGALWAKYAELNRPYFEAPRLEHVVFKNDNNQVQIAEQLIRIPFNPFPTYKYEGELREEEKSGGVDYKTFAVAGLIGLGVFAASKYLGVKATDKIEEMVGSFKP